MKGKKGSSGHSGKTTKSTSTTSTSTTTSSSSTTSKRKRPRHDAREEEEEEDDIMVDTDSPHLKRLIQEEYKLWKKNAPFLYDIVITHALEWPSNTISWLPDKIDTKDRAITEKRLLLGTLTNGTDQNYLMLGRVKLPNESLQTESDREDYRMVSDRIEIFQKIRHDGDVNRARSMPQNHHLIATKSSLSEVTIFDTSKHTVTTEPPGKVKPQIRLGGHTKEGYGLAWNPIRSGMLISGSEDCLICMWDINARSATQPVSPSNIFKGHSSAVEDVAWHVKQEHVFGSVGDDKQLLMWDIREPSRFVQSVVAHKMDVHSIAFNPFCEHLLATSSADKTVALWDLRNLKSRLYELVGHSDEVLPIAWSPHCESVIGSAGRDRRLHVWDLSRIGDKQTAEEAADGPPELLFIHGGHTGSVVDFAFDTRDPWLMSSVAEGNILQTWKMAETIFSECAFTTLSPAPTSTASTTSTSTTTSTSAAAKKGT